MKIKTILLAALLLSTAGCFPGRYTVGGWTLSPTDDNAKATFGGTLRAIDSDGDGSVGTAVANVFVPDPDDTFRGQFQYNDHGECGPAFHATITAGYIAQPGGGGITSFPFRPSSTYQEGSAYFEGTYTPVPRNLGPGGKIEILLISAEQSFGTVDRIWIFLDGGVFDGYDNNVGAFPLGAEVQKGTVKFHPAN